jgi:shikimate dehydrogenase
MEPPDQGAPAVRLGVLGWPVAHSRSPAIHNVALAAANLRWRYQLLPVPPALFEETVRALPGAGFRGANVTIPHKERALALADRTSSRAGAIGAANTLLFASDGTIEADNTDAPALVEALPFGPAGRSAMVLGAGGSARAAVWALLEAGAREVRVWNRSAGRARALCSALGAVEAEGLEPADLLVNCTPAGLDAGEDSFKHLPLTVDQLGRYRCVVDLVYSEKETALVHAARTRSIQVVDGLELLVAQGALSFASFTGVGAPVELMRAAARGRR